LGASQDEIQQVSEDIRALDQQRFEMEVAADDVKACIGIQYTQRNPRPTAPLIKPQHTGQLLNDVELEKQSEVDDRT
jgi:glutathione-regulated potassium-efflux system protein KefB